MNEQPRDEAVLVVGQQKERTRRASFESSQLLLCQAKHLQS